MDRGHRTDVGQRPDDLRAVVSRDPLGVRVDVDLDGASPGAVVDEDVEIVDFQREV